MADRWGALPLGEAPPTCLRCGAQGEPMSYSEAYGWLCVAVAACERRFHERRRATA